MRKVLLIPVVVILAIFFITLFYLLPDSQLARLPTQPNKFQDSLLLAFDTANGQPSTGMENKQDSSESDTEDLKENEIPGLYSKKRPYEVEVFGVVVDADGQPLEGVFVSEELNQRSVRTDINGHYRMPVYVPEYKYPFLIFLRDGFKEERRGVIPNDDTQIQPLEINVSLSDSLKTTSFGGWIGNEFGQGLAGLTVKIISRGSMGLDNIYYSVASRDSGEFHFEGIRSDLIYKLEVVASGDYPSHVIDELKANVQTPRLNIVLNRLKRVDISGMVVNTDSVPVPGVSMKIENLISGSPPQDIVTDSSGFFNLNQFPAGEVKFTGKLPDYFKITGFKLSNSGYQELVLVIDYGTRYLSGWVSDSNGLPVPQARVTIDAEIEAENYQSYSFRSRQTDTSGRFEFKNLSNIDHVITVYAKGYQKREIDHAYSDESEFLTIKLVAQSP